MAFCKHTLIRFLGHIIFFIFPIFGGHMNIRELSVMILGIFEARPFNLI